jgi:hypothetical protein
MEDIYAASLPIKRGGLGKLHRRHWFQTADIPERELVPGHGMVFRGQFRHHLFAPLRDLIGSDCLSRQVCDPHRLQSFEDILASLFPLHHFVFDKPRHRGCSNRLEQLIR